ncbi:hypothetical protein CQ020_05870 [Arthrobacter sp. MYb23]|nr:hypothetical protein CQ038_08500 [Arthrobacter sp. MYb51]PRB97974.1 hypothetical protein CQ020_05870 [Arthrobacter sp. MYb23]
MRQHRKMIRTGVIADVMPDSSMLWLAADQNERRTIYEAAEGYEIWIDPVDMPDRVYLKMICNMPHMPL